MTFFFCDPALSTNLGHHAANARAIVNELRRRSIPVRVLAHQSVTKELQDELGAVPFFSASTYWLNAGDPVSGWLEAFLQAAETTCDQLQTVRFGSGDIIYFNSIQAAGLYGIVHWLSHIQENYLPHVVCEFGVDPGLDLVDGNLQVRNPLVDGRATLYRFVSRQMDERILPKLSMATFEAGGSEAFQTLLGRPVSTLPIPRDKSHIVTFRNLSKPIRIACIGHLRGERGVHLLPEIIRQTIRMPNVTWLVHNGNPNGVGDVQQELRDMAKAEPRIELDERVADAKIWAELLAKCDLIVCPSDPVRFQFSYSAIVCDALANGIPLVVPANTSLARQATEFGCGRMLFEKWEASSVAAAVVEAVKDFDTLARLATVGAAEWRERNGAARCVDALLEMAKP